MGNLALFQRLGGWLQDQGLELPWPPSPLDEFRLFRREQLHPSPPGSALLQALTLGHLWGVLVQAGSSWR